MKTFGKNNKTKTLKSNFLSVFFFISCCTSLYRAGSIIFLFKVGCTNAYLIFSANDTSRSFNGAVWKLCFERKKKKKKNYKHQLHAQ
jgi:hypothetical protein